MSSKYSPLDEIEVGLRYINRLRSMQPSKATMDDLDRREADLKQQQKRLLDASAKNGEISLSSKPRGDDPNRRRAGFF